MVAEMKPTYTVRAQRRERWWILVTPEVPGALSQVRSLVQAEEYIREAIAFILHVEPGSFNVNVVPDLPGLTEKAAQVRADIAALDAAQRKVAAQSRDVVAQLKAQGLTQQDIAAVMGVSPQRVSQIARHAS